MDSVAD